MKIKKILILILILSILINITSINAIENSTDILSESDENNIFVDVNTGDDNNTGDTWQTPVQSIEKAINLTDNRTTNIYLNNGTYTGEKNTNITITNKNIINIIGFKNTIIDGENKNHIFTITNNTKITLQNIQFTNAYINNTISKGGAINIINNKEITIINCKFINNTAEGELVLGGAINIENTEKTIIKNNIFKNNTINLYNNTYSAYGGAINLINNTIIKIENNTITQNNIKRNTNIPFEIESTQIILWKNMKTQGFISYTIHNCTILEKINNYGKAININDSENLEITNNIITNNSNSSGDTLHINNTKNITFYNNTISNNTSTRLTLTKNNNNPMFLDIVNFALITNGTVNIENSENLKIIDNTLKNNIIENGNGGALYLENINQTTIKNNTLANNTALYSGGAILIKNCNQTEIKENKLSNNKATYKDKSILSRQTFDETEYLTIIENAKLVKLKVYTSIKTEEYYDSAKNIFKNKLSYTINMIKGTTATGGAVYIENSNKAKINNNTFLENDANTGGSIYITNSKKIEINNTIIKNNTAFQYIISGDTNIYMSGQGIIYLNNTTASIENCNINGNYMNLAKNDYLTTFSIIQIENSNTTIKNTYFIKNKVSCGTIQNNGYTEIFNCTFQENIGNQESPKIEATIKYEKGNGADIHNKGYCNIINTTIKNTKVYAGSRGGSIYNNGTLILKNSEISGIKSLNTLNYDGHSVGAAIGNIGNITIIDSTIKDNIIRSAYNTRFQGTIHNEGLLTAKRTIFMNNTALNGGQNPTKDGIDVKSLDTGSGNIYNLGGTLNITECIFINPQQGILYHDIANLGGTIISLDNNYWNGVNPNIYRNTNVNIQKYIILSAEPEYSALKINESVNITAKFLLNNLKELKKMNLPFEKLNLTFKTKVNNEVINITKTPVNNTATFNFNWTQEKGTFPSNITYGIECKPLMTTYQGRIIIKTPITPSKDVLIEVGKEFTNMNVEAKNITYGENITVKINITGNASHQPTGNISIYLLNYGGYQTLKQYSINITDGQAELSSLYKNLDTYMLKIVYEGDELYCKNYTTTYVSIGVKLNMTLPESIYVDETLIINVSKTPESPSTKGTIYVNGKKFSTISYNKDKVTLTYKNYKRFQTEGTYNITITYNINNYETSTSEILTIKRHETELTLNASDIMIGENLTINATLTPDAVPGGNATIIINNQTNSSFLNKGTTQINIENLKAGTYNITINYFGTNKYAPSSASTTINVHKYPSNLTVNRTTYDNLTGTITVNALGSGNVTLWINNKNYTQQILNNTTTFHITYLNGTNYIFIFYTGDEYYEYATWNLTENITYKYYLKAENMTYYQNEEFNYTITLLNATSQPLQDYVNITFQNTPYQIKTDTDGKIYFPLKLKKGTYNITVQYNQTTLKNIINITTADTYPEMNINTNNITYGEDLTVNINITPKATGTVTINIDNQTQTVKISQGHAIATFNNITGGIQKITATYNGDNKYRIITEEKTITVDKADTILTITTGNITLGENIYIYAHTNRNDATGLVTFSIDELYNPRNRTLTDNKATWYISPLPRGQYKITATYNGDTNYNPSTATYTLTVDPEINITTKNVIEYGDTIEIEISTTPIPGKINIEIDTINETINLTDGKAKINIENTLNPGNYTIKTTLISENYTKTIPMNLTVTKANPIKDIYIKDILAGETEEIQITLKDNTLKYKIQIDNKNYDTLNFTIPGLTKGEHTLHIEITGNDNYTDINQTIRFNVKSYTSTINITSANITYGEDLNVKATITENATGNITYKIANQIITTTDKEITIKDLPAGIYNLTVTYNGDEYYQSSTATQSVEVKKAESTIEISTGEIIPGENIFIYATTNNGTTGNVTFRIIGQFSPRNITLKNNTATWYIQSLPRGIYTITALYLGDNNYNPSNATYIMAIDPKINLTINTQDTGYGEEIIIEANTDLNGMVNFQIENINENVTIVNGKATLKIDDKLNTGIYTVYATYINKNFQSETITANLTIIKTSPIKEINIKDVLAGEREKIQITMKDSSLKYRVSVDNKDYDTLDIVIPMLTKGEHILHIEVTGNDNYNDINETIKFYGKTQTSSINITAANITYGEELNVKVIVTENATGNITYKIAAQTITTTDKQITIKNIPAGTYTLTVTYNGNSYYQSSTATQPITVSKAEPEINISIDAKSSEDPVNITVRLNHDATGTITYRINGLYSPRNHTITDGKDSWIIESLENGEYELVITYNGDDNYNAKQVTEKININQIKTHLTANLTVNPDNSVTITAELISDDNSTINTDITLAVANKFYRMKITNNTGLFTTPILSNGDYRYSLAYSGTVKYTSSNTNGVFSIKENIQLNITATINSDDTVTLNISLSKNKNVTLTLNDKEYALEIINGSKAFTTPRLIPGEYTYTVRYDGDENTHPANQTGTVTIKSTPKLEYTIDINPDNSATLKINTTIENGNITLQINNKNYLVKIMNNTGLYTTPVLDNGNYTYNIIFDGDKNTKNLTKTGKLTIKNNAVLTVSSLVKYYSGTERLNITLTYKNQPLTNETIYITINGITYKRTTNEDGEVSMPINLPSSTYNATVTFNNTQYNTINKNIAIQIKNTVYGNDITKVYRNGTQYYAIFTDSTGKLLTNTAVTFNINGVFYERTTNEQGIAKLNINLEQGTYILTATNPATKEQYSNTITVISKIQKNSNLIKYYRNNSQYIAKIIKSDGNIAGAGEKVTFNINGVFYERYTNESGHVKLNINLEPGEYIITAEYDGCKVSNNITVLTTIKTSNLVKKYSDRLPFTATILDGEGNPLKDAKVTFNINGVMYERTTNTYGQARLNINLQAGKYIITTTYNGLNTANIITIRN